MSPSPRCPLKSCDRAGPLCASLQKPWGCRPVWFLQKKRGIWVLTHQLPEGLGNSISEYWEKQEKPFQATLAYSQMLLRKWHVFLTSFRIRIVLYCIETCGFHTNCCGHHRIFALTRTSWEEDQERNLNPSADFSSRSWIFTQMWSAPLWLFPCLRPLAL